MILEDIELVGEWLDVYTVIGVKPLPLGGGCKLRYNM
jgi:hypothetical protein